MNQLLEALLINFVKGLAGSLVFLVPLWGPQLVLRRKATAAVDAHSSPLTARVATIGVADGLVLMSFMACANAIVGYLRDEIPFAALVLQGICINLLVFLVWYQCQKLMRHYGFLNPRARVMIQVVMYPLCLVASGQVIVAAITLITSAVAQTRVRSSGDVFAQTASAACLLVVFTLVLVGLRVVFARMRLHDALVPNLDDAGQTANWLR